MTPNPPNMDSVESMPIETYSDSSYLNYSMYVIRDRALPHIADGLKPVHRRILYSMHQLRLNAQAKYKKSARTVGDTLGKYHPHGDSACYEAMVLMAQTFSTRNPLVDGQGNWGSPDDPKSFAAMRYTESRMTAYADSLLAEINQDTVDWKDNFDGTMEEPKLLPAQLPNILLNGTTGIAVGMATDIPPHNMEEVVNACVAMLQKSRSTDDDILSHITVPDFPTGGEVISPLKQVHDAYRLGRGKFRVRATLEYTPTTVKITSLPYQVSTDKLLIALDEVIQKKKLPVTRIREIRNDDSPTQLELYIKGREKQDLVMTHLFAETNLETTVKVNLNMIGRDGRPEVKPLPNIIREWCECRQEFFERKKRFRLRKVEARLHILDGLLIAFSNLDEVIRIVRESDQPRQALESQFGLTEKQAKAILELRLRQLARLEEDTLRTEHAELSAERDALVALLADDKKIKRAVISELKAALKLHQTPRLTIHNERSESVPVKQLAISKEPCTTVLSRNGWLRAVKGHDADLSKLPYKGDDAYLAHVEGRTDQPAILMGDAGRFFAVMNHALPNGKSTGEPISKHLILQDGERIKSLLPYYEERHVLLTTAKGKGFRVPMSTLDTRAKKGKHVLVLTEKDKALPTHILNGQNELMLVTRAGRISIVPIDSINVSNKSQGIRLIDVKQPEFEEGADELAFVLPLSEKDNVAVYVGKRKFLLTPDKRNTYRAKLARRGIFFESGRNITQVEISV